MPYRTPAEREADEPPPDPRGPWVLQTWVSKRVCPDCGVLLFAARKEGYRVDACGECGGAWLTHDMAARAVAERDLAPALLAEQAARRATGRVGRPERTCPECREPLLENRLHDARMTLDICAAHGVWFDPGEMRAAIVAVVARTPLPVDPEVERAIAQAEREGALRPPVDYQPPALMWGPAPEASVGKVLELLVRMWRDR